MRRRCACGTGLDDKFDQPRVCAYFHVTLPAIEPTAAAYVAADVLTLCVHDSLQDEVRYPAELASLNAGLDVVGQHTMLSFTFDGFNDKLGELVKSYFGAVSAFDVNESRFEKIKEKRLKDLKNYGLKPGRQARSLLHQLLKDREASEQSKIDALERLTSDALRAFARAAWSAAAHVEGLVIGNVTADEALRDGRDRFAERSRARRSRADAFPTRRITHRPPRRRALRAADAEPRGGHQRRVRVLPARRLRRTRLRGMHLLVHQLIGGEALRPAAHEGTARVRRERELGEPVRRRRVSSHRGVARSTRPKFVEERIDAFLRRVPEAAREMDDAELRKTRRSWWTPC